MSEQHPAFTDADLIYEYTRQMAIDDGTLVDITEAAKEAGFSIPVAVTRAVWLDCIAWDDKEDSAKQTIQHQAGRLWDVVWMASHAARNHKSADRATFELYRVPRDGKSKDATKIELILHVGPGDTPESVITIMLEGDD